MAEPNRKQRRAAQAQSRKAGTTEAPTKTAKDAILEVAREARDADDQRVETTLTTGAKAWLRPVSPALIQDVQVAIPNPDVPKVWAEEKQREYENPDSPAYLAALERAQAERIQATLDAQVFFGVELEEGFEVPPEWVKRLKLFAKRRGLEFDETDPDEVEYYYKKYGVSNSHLVTLSALSGLGEEDIERFRDLFRGQETRDTDS